MNRKIIKAVVLCVVVLGILSACNNDKDGNKSSPTLSTEQLAADKAAQDEVDAVYPNPNMGQFARVSAQTGWDVYVPGDYGYRYGPTLLLNPDGSIDLWTASNGAVGQWDWIRYKKSTDGGKTWTNDVIALKPTPNSLDVYSTCDPGVIKIGKYYYIGYTSTTDAAGIYNHVYVARSLNPAGPYDKWNGQGWGGNPQPLIWFDGPAECWGAGEPSFVVKNGVLYIYYTWNSKNANGKAFQETRVATASALDENWPSKMEFKGTAIVRADGEDSTDVKFVEETGKFIGIATEKRLTKDSRLTIYQSDDGITFKRTGNIKTNTPAFLHNAGISSRPNGHISITDQNYISYAYGPKWGTWATMLNPISFSESGEVVDPETTAKNLSIEVPTTSKPKGDILNILASKPLMLIATTAKKNTLMLYALYNDDSLIEVTDNKEVTYYDYDKSIIEINSEDGTVTALSVGITNVTVKYKEFTDVFAVKTFVAIGPLRVEAKSSTVESNQWSPDRLIDSDNSTVWSSNSAASGDKWVTVKLDKVQVVRGITLTPRSDGQNFPVDFYMQYSNDGTNWINIEAQSYKNHANPKNIAVNFNFPNPIEAQYIKIVCTKADSKTHYFQLGEIDVIGEEVPYVATLNAIRNSGIISVSKKADVQIKLYREMNNGTITEIFKSTDGLIYSNYDKELVTVTKDGLIKVAGNKLGKTTITILLGDKSSNFEIEVIE